MAGLSTEPTSLQDNDTTDSSSDPPAETVITQVDGKLLYLEKPDTPSDVPVLKTAIINNRAPSLSQNTLDQSLKRDTIFFIVISTLSGAQLAEAFADSVLLPLLKELQISTDKFKVIRTKDADTVTQFAKDTLLENANNGTSQLVILLSGDGGVVDILNGLTPRSSQYVAPEISLIPMGTGNALANSSGLADPTYGLAALVRGQPKNLPTLKVKFSASARLLVNEGKDQKSLPTDGTDGTPVLYGAVVCSWGLHAALVADSDTAEYRKHGAERFKMAANEALYPTDGSPPHHYKAKLSLRHRGEESWTDVEQTEHAYVLTTLVSNLERGFTISPASQPLDGSMRILYFGPRSGDEVMDVMTKAYQGGKHVRDTPVTYAEVDGVRIRFQNLETDGRWRRVCVDGKIVVVESDGWLEIDRQDEFPLFLRHLD